MAVGQGLRVGDIERRRDRAVSERVDQIAGDNVLTPSHVDEEGVAFHEPELVGADDALSLGSEGERKHDEVGPRERFVQTLRLDDDIGSVHGLHTDFVPR